MRTRSALAALLLPAHLAAARRLTVLTVGKVADLQERRRHGPRRTRSRGSPARPRPPARPPRPSSCRRIPSRRSGWCVTTHVTLDCSQVEARRRGGFVYGDPAATGGVRSVRYGRKGLAGPVRRQGFRPPAGPVGYVQAWLTVGATRFNTRFHNFARNEADALVTRKPSARPATGERAFWAVLHHDWQTPHDKAQSRADRARLLHREGREARQAGRLVALPARHDPPLSLRSGVDALHDVSDVARGEIEAAHAAFQEAVPLLWDGPQGDSRVPGFAAAATFGLGVGAATTPRCRQQGMAELDAAFALNPFFNVFDYIPVVQAVSVVRSALPAGLRHR